MNSEYATKEMFYRNLRSVNISFKVDGRAQIVPFVSSGYFSGYKILKDSGFDNYSYAFVPEIRMMGKNGETLFSAEGFLIPDEFIKEFVEKY